MLCALLVTTAMAADDVKKDAPKGAGGVGPGPLTPPVSTSQLQIVAAPADITSDGDCRTLVSALVVRPTADNLHGPVIVGGGLEDADSHRALPAGAFRLVAPDALAGACPDRTHDVTKTTPMSSPTSPKLVTLYLVLDPAWVVAGTYSGTLLLAATEDTGAQPVKLKVSVRPVCAWVVGILLLALGAGLSWFATVWATRHRQSAGNQILIQRLQALLVKLEALLERVAAAGAPHPEGTLAHLQDLRARRLRELLSDRELSIIAGVTVPPEGRVPVLDEIEGVSRVVQQGFGELLDRWRAASPPPDQLTPLFRKMDALGRTAQALDKVDAELKSIAAQAQTVAPALKGARPSVLLGDLPREDAIVHRVVVTSYVLDVLSSATVVAIGAYVLIWKNPGFGSGGDLLVSFLWGLGLKLGADAARLGPSDVRTAYGIKVPSAP